MQWSHGTESCICVCACVFFHWCQLHINVSFFFKKMYYHFEARIGDYMPCLEAHGDKGSQRQCQGTLDTFMLVKILSHPDQ